MCISVLLIACCSVALVVAGRVVSSRIQEERLKSQFRMLRHFLLMEVKDSRDQNPSFPKYTAADLNRLVEWDGRQVSVATFFADPVNGGLIGYSPITSDGNAIRLDRLNSEPGERVIAWAVLPQSFQRVVVMTDSLETKIITIQEVDLGGQPIVAPP